MKDDKNWFGAKFPCGGRRGFHAFPVRPPVPRAVKSPAQTPQKALPNSGFPARNACWTASLHRGNDLPPFLLCVHTTAESRSASGSVPSTAVARLDRGLGLRFGRKRIDDA